MAVNKEQQQFLERLAACIPRLFDAIRAGNVKSEFYIGLRRVDDRQVQLKMVAEVLDPGENPLKTHGMQAPGSEIHEGEPASEDTSDSSASASKVAKVTKAAKTQTKKC